MIYFIQAGADGGDGALGCDPRVVRRVRDASK